MTGARLGLGLLLVALGPLGAAAAEPGVTESGIVVGCAAPLSGPLGPSAQQTTQFGVDLYFKVVNDAGGIHGRRVRTIYYDDKGRVKETLAATQRLVVEDRVFAVLAPQGVAPVAAVLDYLEAQKVPLIFPLQGSPVVRGRKHVVAGTMLYDRQSRATIDYLTGPRKARRIAVLYQNDEYGKSFLGFVRKDLTRRGLKPVAVVPVERGQVEMGTPMATARAARPDVLLLVLTPGPAANALKERQKLGWAEVIVVATGPLADERYLAIAGDAAEGVEALALWPDPLTSDLPGVRQYRDHLRRHFPKNEPNRASLAGYFAAMLLTEGARRAGRDLTRETLLAALEGLRGWDNGILSPITIGRDHEVQKRALWARLERGRFKPVTDWLPSD